MDLKSFGWHLYHSSPSTFHSCLGPLHMHRGTTGASQGGRYRARSLLEKAEAKRLNLSSWDLPIVPPPPVFQPTSPWPRLPGPPSPPASASLAPPAAGKWPVLLHKNPYAQEFSLLLWDITTETLESPNSTPSLPMSIRNLPWMTNFGLTLVVNPKRHSKEAPHSKICQNSKLWAEKKKSPLKDAPNKPPQKWQSRYPSDWTHVLHPAKPLSLIKSTTSDFGPVALPTIPKPSPEPPGSDKPGRPGSRHPHRLRGFVEYGDVIWCTVHTVLLCYITCRKVNINYNNTIVVCSIPACSNFRFCALPLPSFCRNSRTLANLTMVGNCPTWKNGEWEGSREDFLSWMDLESPRCFSKNSDGPTWSPNSDPPKYTHLANRW